MRDLENLIKDAKALPAGIPLRITKAENDRMIERMQTLFSKPVPNSAPISLAGRRIQVVD